MVALFSVAFSITMLVYGLRKSRGKSLQVTLAVSDLKKQREAGDAFAPDTLPAAAPHKEFVSATSAMNERLNALAGGQAREKGDAE